MICEFSQLRHGRASLRELHQVYSRQSYDSHKVQTSRVGLQREDGRLHGALEVADRHVDVVYADHLYAHTSLHPPYMLRCGD